MTSLSRLRRLILSPLGMRLILIILALAAGTSALVAGVAYRDQQKLLNYVLNEYSRPVTSALLKTNFGEIEIVFDTPAVAAKDNFIKLARENYYDGQLFHRVVKNFAIQTGDPLSRNPTAAARWGTGGPGYTLPKEVSTTDDMATGSVIMANSGTASHGSQFMILVDLTPWLIGENTLFAHVVRGQDVVQAISDLDTGVTGIPASEARLLDIQLK